MEDCGSSRKSHHNSKGIDSKEVEEIRKLEECKLIKEKCFSPVREKKKENITLNSGITKTVPSVEAFNLKYKNHLTKVDIQLIKAEISRLIDPYLTPDDRKRLDMVLQYAFKSCNILIERRGPRPFPSSKEIGTSNLFEPLKASDTNLTEKVREYKVAEMVQKIDKLTTPFLHKDIRKKLNKIIVSILSNGSMVCDYDPTPLQNKGTLDTNLGTLHQDDFKNQKDTFSSENSLNMLPIPQDSAVSDNKDRHRYYLTANSKEVETPVEFEQHERAAEIYLDDTAAEPQLSSPVPYFKKEPLENENTLSLLNIAPCENQYSFPGPDSNMKPPTDEAFSPEVIPNKIALNNYSSNEGHDEKTYDSINYTKDELDMKDCFKMNSHHPSHLFTIKSYLTSEENTSLLGEPLKGYSSSMLSRDPTFNIACKVGLATGDYAPTILTDENIPNKIALNNYSSNEGHDEKTYDSINYTKEELDMKDCFKINSHHPSHLYTIKSYLTSEENTSLLGEPLKGYSSSMLSRDPTFNIACKAGLATGDYAPTILTDEKIREILAEINRQTSEYIPPNSISKLMTEIHCVLRLAANENARVHSVPDENSFHTLPDKLKYLVKSVECCRCAMDNNENIGRYTNQQIMFYSNNRSYSSGNADGNEFSHSNKGGEKYYDLETGILSTRTPNGTYIHSESFNDAHDDMAKDRNHCDYPGKLDLTDDEKGLIRRQDLLHAIETFLDEISPRGFNPNSIQETMKALRKQGKIEFVRHFFQNELSGLSAISQDPNSAFPPPTPNPKYLSPIPATSFCASLEVTPCCPRLPHPPGSQPRICSCPPPPLSVLLCPGPKCPSEEGPPLAPAVSPCPPKPKPSCGPPKSSSAPPKPSCPPPKPKPCPPKPKCPSSKPKCSSKPECPSEPKSPPKPECPSKPKCPSTSKPQCLNKSDNKCLPKNKKPSCKPKKCIKQSYRQKKRCSRPKRKSIQQFRKHARRQQTIGILTEDLRIADIIKFHCYQLYRRIVSWIQSLSQLGANALNFREFEPWLPIPNNEGPPADPIPCRKEADPPIQYPIKPKLKPWYIYIPPNKDLPPNKKKPC